MQTILSYGMGGGIHGHYVEYGSQGLLKTKKSSAIQTCEIRHQSWNVAQRQVPGATQCYRSCGLLYWDHYTKRQNRRLAT
jgi:hypothetical protein